MFYYKENNGVIEKYAVDFDINAIETLKNKIIENCSYIKHVEKKDDYFPNFANKNLIKNFNSIKVGEKEYFEEIRDVFLFSYDEYCPPYLVTLMNKLLKSNSEVLNEIFNYSIPSELDLDDEINSLWQDFNVSDNADITKKKLILKKLEYLLSKKEMNAKEQNITPYYNELISLIKLNLVATISLSDLKRAEEFLGIELLAKLNLEHRETKILKNK